MSKSNTLFFRADDHLKDRIELERAAAQKMAGKVATVTFSAMVRHLVTEALDARSGR